jgi:NitT/TauT family transport system ATP-binding protein
MTTPHVDVATLLPSETALTTSGKLKPPRPMRPYQTLPHVAISDVTGLIELVHARGGREDLYQLGRHLQLEIDDLLPLVEAADLLDLADAQEGDLVLTEVGKRFAEAGVLEEKQIFRDQALTNIAMIRRIVHDLEQNTDHTAPEGAYMDVLKAHFSEDEAWAQLETIIDWGRYAELFSYIEERGIFRLEDSETVSA